MRKRKYGHMDSYEGCICKQFTGAEIINIDERDVSMGYDFKDGLPWQPGEISAEGLRRGAGPVGYLSDGSLHPAVERPRPIQGESIQEAGIGQAALSSSVNRKQLVDHSTMLEALTKRWS